MESDIPSEDLVRLLPATLPIFPLEGALLLPHGQLPLHIFEPRYRNMVENALASGRMLGMIQPRGGQPQPTPDQAELFETGCVGRIVAFTETDDGRFFITIKGVCRFRIGEELPLHRGFRRVVPDYLPFHEDFKSVSGERVDRARLLSSAKTYLTLNNIECDWSAAEAASSQALITSLAMSCAFEPEEKQALLECGTLDERCDLLISLFEMAALSAEMPAAGTRH